MGMVVVASLVYLGLVMEQMGYGDDSGEHGRSDFQQLA